jgi:RNA polymerase sigma-70 factor (ECF subfamily)
MMLERMCFDAAQAEDLTQETFVRIMRARGTFAEGAAAMPWMLAIARNAFRDHLRRERARRRVDADAGIDPAFVGWAWPEGSGYHELLGRELLALVRDTLLGLPLAQREAFAMMRLDGLSAADAAEALGTSEVAVRVRAFRASEAVRVTLERERTNGGRS